MDPNETLKRIRRLTASADLSDDELEELVTLVKALDDWISKGGFLPDAWRTYART